MSALGFNVAPQAAKSSTIKSNTKAGINQQGALTSHSDQNAFKPSDILRYPPPWCPGSKMVMEDISSKLIPADISVFMMPVNDFRHPRMGACCNLHRVQVAEGCYLWCEVPEIYLNSTTDPTIAHMDFLNCLNTNGMKGIPFLSQLR